MIADIMHTFHNFSYEYIMKIMSFKEFILWHMQACRIMYEIDINLKDSYNVDKELDSINNNFKWNDEKGRWE